MKDKLFNSINTLSMPLMLFRSIGWNEDKNVRVHLNPICRTGSLLVRLFKTKHVCLINRSWNWL
jgi:hypothetical protein